MINKDDPNQPRGLGVGGGIFAVFSLIVITIVVVNPIPSFFQRFQSSNNSNNLNISQSDRSTDILSSNGEHVRRTRVMNGEEYIENVFYVGLQEVAKQKVAKGEILDTTGNIPDGKFKFYDEYRKTYGEEYYEDGRKEGEETTYYEDGKLCSRSFYHRGELKRMSEYYGDGKIRFEVDYSDVREVGDPKERGIGKLYFQNGKIKYEWNVTNAVQPSFKRSFNSEGEMTLTVYLDDQGNPIKPAEPKAEQLP